MVWANYSEVCGDGATITAVLESSAPGLCGGSMEGCENDGLSIVWLFGFVKPYRTSYGSCRNQCPFSTTMRPPAEVTALFAEPRAECVASSGVALNPDCRAEGNVDGEEDERLELSWFAPAWESVCRGMGFAHSLFHSD